MLINYLIKLPKKVNTYQFIINCLIAGNEKYLWFCVS